MGTNKDDKDKALEAALVQIQKQFGKGAVMKPHLRTRPRDGQ